MSKPEDNSWTDLVQRLDLIISLLLDKSETSSSLTMTDKIVRLKELGAPPAQVAQILRKPLNYITGVNGHEKEGKTSWMRIG